jgi:hypothetical protein
MATIHLRASGGSRGFVGVDSERHWLMADRSQPTERERFRLLDLDGGSLAHGNRVALRAWGDRYVQVAVTKPSPGETPSPVPPSPPAEESLVAPAAAASKKS